MFMAISLYSKVQLMNEVVASGEHDASLHAPTWTQSWELIMPVEGTGICSGISAVEFKDKIYAFFITEKTPNNLQLSHLVFSKGTDKALIVERQEDFSINGLTRHRPSVTVHDGHLFCFHTVRDQTVHYHVYSGTEWSHGGTVPGVLTDQAPSAVSYKDTLYLALQGTYNGEFYHKAFQNFEWGDTINSPGLHIKGSPSLCQFGDTLSVAFTGLDDGMHLFNFFSGKWEFIYKSPHYKVSGSPALYARNNYLVCASLAQADQHVLTETLLERTGSTPSLDVTTHLDRTVGTYLSEPCLIEYKDRFYLIGRRPCNDVGISLFKTSIR